MPFGCKQILNFYDLRTFDAKFLCECKRTFSAEYFGLKRKIRYGQPLPLMLVAQNYVTRWYLQQLQQL